MPKHSPKYPKLTVRQYNRRPSTISEAHGPSANDQLNALITDSYWTVLNVKRYFTDSKLKEDQKLCLSVNAFKHALQTYGPYAKDDLPDFKSGKGKTNGHVYHGHASGSNKTEYVIEWTVIDPERKIMAIVGFGSHENFNFLDRPLTADNIAAIFANAENQKILEQVARLRKDAKAKYVRITANEAVNKP